MSVYHDNLEILADFYVDAANLEGEERNKEALELMWFLEKLFLKATPRARSIFLSLVDLEDDGYPWSALYPVGEAAPPALILVIHQHTEYVDEDQDVDVSRMDDTTRKEWETAVELSQRLATGWLPDEWKPTDDDDTVIVDDDDDTVIVDDQGDDKKPPVSKPPVSKPPVSKPPVSKPPVSKPPADVPRKPGDVSPLALREAIIVTSLLGLGAGLGAWGLWAAFKKD